MTIVARMLTQEKDDIPGYTAHPDGPGPRPGILMVHHAHGVTADYKVDAFKLAKTLACASLVFCGGLDYIATPAIQGPLWQSFIANGRLVEWHFFSDANHGFRHPTTDSSRTTPISSGPW